MDKKIVFFSGNDHTPWGGSEELWAATALQLLSEKYPVHIFNRAWHDLPNKIKELQIKGAQLHLYSFGQKGLLERGLNKIFPKKSIYTKTFEDSLGLSPDLYVISLGNTYNQAREWLSGLKSSGKKYVLIVSLASEFFWPPDEVLKEFVEIYSNAEKVYFLAEKNRNIVERQLGVKLPNAELIFTPRTVGFDEVPTWKNDDHFFHIACAGRLMPLHKGQDLLLEVLNQDKWRTRNLKMKLYGNGENEASLKRLALTYNLEKVSFHPFTNDVRNIWNDNHAAIFPSRMEGMPLALIEAMLCYRMAIVTDVAGHAEVVRDNETGFIAEAPTVQHIDEAMERAWNNREHWREMGLKAGETIRRLVPEQPAIVFAEKLKQLIN